MLSDQNHFVFEAPDLMVTPILEAHFPPKEAFVEKIISVASRSLVKKAVEFGCGRGVEAQLLAELTGWDILATDASTEVLQAVSEKLVTQKLDVTLPFSDWLRDFDVAYCSFVVHLLSNEGKRQFFENCFHCLAKDGIFLCLTASEEDLQRRFLASYFPSALIIDYKRYSTVHDNEMMLRMAGFSNVFHERILLGVVNIPDSMEFYHKRLSSILRLIPKEEYEAGIRKMELDLQCSKMNGQIQMREWWRTLLVAKR
jgi:SAM-dependent methyltransferase